MENKRVFTTYLIIFCLLLQLFFIQSIHAQEIKYNEFGGIINVRGIFNHGNSRDNKNIKDYLFNRSDSEYDADVIPLPIFEEGNQSSQQIYGFSGEDENDNNDNEPLQIQARLQLVELTKFDTLNEELNVLLDLYLLWNDHRLKFNPENFNNVHRIDLPAHYVWTPNIGITNDITGHSRFTTEDNTNKVEIWSSGLISWKTHNAKIIKCKMNMKHFPFDLQKCTLILDSLTDLGKVNLTLFQTDDNFDKEQKLNLWKIVDSRLSKSKQPVDEYCSTCKAIRYTIILKRISSSYITDIIVPCTLLCLLSGFSLWIRAGNSQRLELNLSVLIAISVYQLLASSNLPTGDSIPDLTLFLLVQNVLVFMSIVTTLLLWQFKSRIKHGMFSGKKTIKANVANIKLQVPISKFVYKFFVKYIGFLIFMRFDPEFQRILNKVEEIEDHLEEIDKAKKSDKEKEFKLIELKIQLFLTTVDRFFAVLFLLILIGWVIWMFVAAPDDDKTIEDFWRQESEM